MKALAWGLRELGLVARRCVLRVRLWRERRALARCEMALGLLGWQQADYDATAQEPVNRLMDCERAQAGLTNESAARALEIARLGEERAARQTTWERRRATLLAEAQPGLATSEDLEALVNVRRKEGRGIEARLPVLDRETQVAERQYRALVLAEATPESQHELGRLRKTILALPQESADWRARLEQTQAELRRLEKLLAAVREAREEFGTGDSALAKRVDAEQRAKKRIEKEIGALEKAKSDPYRAIGAVLADHGIAPLNQPETLRAVLDQRAKVQAVEATIAASHEASASNHDAGR